MTTRAPLRRGLMVLALVPVLLSGCAGASSSSSGGDTADTGAGGTGESWIVATQGSPTPSARPRFGPAPSPSPVSGFLPLATPTATRTPTHTCSPTPYNFSRVNGLDVTTGPTSAVLGWYNGGGTNLVEFRLYAISQDLKMGAQRDPGYVVVKPRRPCGDITATIGNLDRGTKYVFSVDAVVTRRSGEGTRSATVARSHSVATR